MSRRRDSGVAGCRHDVGRKHTKEVRSSERERRCADAVHGGERRQARRQMTEGRATRGREVGHDHVGDSQRHGRSWLWYRRRRSRKYGGGSGGSRRRRRCHHKLRQCRSLQASPLVTSRLTACRRRRRAQLAMEAGETPRCTPAPAAARDRGGSNRCSRRCKGE